MPLGHTNLSYYKAKTAHIEMDNRRKAPAGQCLRVGGGRGDRMRPCYGGPCCWSLSDLGFLSVKGGELLLTNSFVVTVQVEFIKSIVGSEAGPPNR